jgi:hypothetical protein
MVFNSLSAAQPAVAPDHAPSAQIGGPMRFFVDLVAQALSHSRAAGEPRAIRRCNDG